MWDECASKFLFEIGEVVMHKAGRECVVVSRTINQCHGGMQREYVCGAMGFDGHMKTVCNESELKKQEK